MEIKKALHLGICCIFLFSCLFSKFKTKHKYRKIEHMKIAGVSAGCGTEKIPPLLEQYFLELV